MYILITFGLFLTTSLAVPLPRSDTSRSEPPLEMGTEDSRVRALASKEDKFPINIIPREYHITITPNFENSTFKGEVIISFGLRMREITKIYLDMEDLDIDSTVLIADYGNLNINSTEYDKDEHFLTITLTGEMLQLGNFNLQIKYTGIMRNDGLGLFSESYFVDDETRSYAATNFFPQHAKKVFPCLDRIDHPTLFKLTVFVPQDYNVISNTKANVTEVEDLDLFMYEFETTPEPIIIYRFGFIISQMTKISASSEPIPVSIHGRKLVSGNGDFAVMHAQLALIELGNYTDMDYQDFMKGTEIDLVAMPTKFHTFENSGLAGTWEQYIAYDPSQSSSRHHQELVLAITKQLSSQWWGVLVSEVDYIHAWLFEALRTFSQYHVGNYVEDDLGLLEQFNNRVLHEVLRKDSDDNSKAVATTNPTTDPENFILRGLKGATVLQMLLHLMDEQHYKTAIRNFLYPKNMDLVTSSEFFASFHRVIQDGNLFRDYEGLVLEIFTSSWLDKPGYPLITISLDEMQNVIAEQERYFDNEDSESEDTYVIPLTWTRKEDADFDSLKPKLILWDKNITLEEGLFEEDEWIIVNVQQSGLYRVNYADELWDRIIAAMKNANSRKDIHKLNRAQLIDDCLNLARSGRVSFEIALSLSESLEHEQDYVVWDAAIDDFKYLISRASGVERQADRLRSFLRTHSVEFLKRVQYDNDLDPEDHLQSLTIATLMEIACSTDDPECIRRALQQFNDINKVPSDLHPAVYCTAVRELGDEAFDILLDRYHKEDLYAEQIVILQALGCSRDPIVVRRALDLAVEEESQIPINDRWIIFESVVSEFGNNVNVALDFLNDNSDSIWDIYGSLNNVAEVLSSLIEHIHTNNQINKLEEVLKDGELSDAMPENGLVKARGHVKFGADYNNDIEAWLEERGYSSSGIITSSVTLITFLIIALFCRQ